MVVVVVVVVGVVVVVVVVVVAVGVVGGCNLKLAVPSSNVVAVHVVLYKLHRCLFALYEIPWHCASAKHAFWHASKVTIFPAD